MTRGYFLWNDFRFIYKSIFGNKWLSQMISQMIISTDKSSVVTPIDTASKILRDFKENAVSSMFLNYFHLLHYWLTSISELTTCKVLSLKSLCSIFNNLFPFVFGKIPDFFETTKWFKAYIHIVYFCYWKYLKDEEQRFTLRVLWSILVF